MTNLQKMKENLKQSIDMMDSKQFYNLMIIFEDIGNPIKVKANYNINLEEYFTCKKCSEINNGCTNSLQINTDSCFNNFEKYCNQ